MPQPASDHQSKSKTAKRPRTRKRAQTLRPHILLVGNAHRTADLKATLHRIKTSLECVSGVDDVSSHLRDNTLAVILVSPLPKLRLPRAVVWIRGVATSRELAIFALATDGIADSEARRLYREGATAVLEWPQERFVFPLVLVELLALDLVHGIITEPDAALARTVCAHLKLVRGYGRRLRVRVDAGVVFITGSTQHLWQNERIQAVVSDIPGVRNVVVRWLHVEPSERTDAEIHRSIVQLLRDTSNIDESTLAVTVEQGYVTLAGSVTDRRELNRARKLITNVKGVRHVDRLAVVSPSQKQRDYVVARRLSRILKQLFPDASVRATYFGGAAVLSGQVDRLCTNVRIQETVDDDDAVQRVVNKIEVVSKAQKGA